MSEKVTTEEYFIGGVFGAPYDPLLFTFALPVDKGYCYMTRLRVKCGDPFDESTLAASVGNVPVWAQFVGTQPLFSKQPNNLVGANSGAGSGFLNLQPNQGPTCSDTCDWEGLFFLRQGPQSSSGLYSILAAVDSNDLQARGIAINLLLVTVSFQVVISTEPLYTI